MHRCSCFVCKRRTTNVSDDDDDDGKFRNSFTATISCKFAIKRSLNISPNLKLVSTVPCKKLMSENYLISEIRHIISLQKKFEI